MSENNNNDKRYSIESKSRKRSSVIRKLETSKLSLINKDSFLEELYTQKEYMKMGMDSDDQGSESEPSGNLFKLIRFLLLINYGEWN